MPARRGMLTVDKQRSAGYTDGLSPWRGSTRKNFATNLPHGDCRLDKLMRQSHRMAAAAPIGLTQSKGCQVVSESEGRLQFLSIIHTGQLASWNVGHALLVLK